MKKKKKNPRRIPMPKSQIDYNSILEEATKDDMYRAWLLIASNLIELEYVSPTQVGTLADQINKQIGAKQFKSNDYEIRRIERLIGVSNPYDNLDISQVKSTFDLEKFKKKVERVAIHTSLCVIGFGLDASSEFSAEQLRRLFLNVDLTLAEIDAGCTTYKALENGLAEKNMMIQVVDNNDCTEVLVQNDLDK